MLNKILEKLGFERTKDVWEENERLRAKLSLAEKRQAAAETNVSLLTTNRDHFQSLYYVEDKKYKDACLRVIELEGEVNIMCEVTMRAHKYPVKGK